MSGSIAVAVDKPSNAWRQRGFLDGDADRAQRPPADPALASAYRAGYRKAVEARARRADEDGRLASSDGS